MSKRPSAIYNDPGHLYNQGLLAKLFALASAALAISILWWIWQDFDRPWKDEQRAEMKWEARRLSLEAMVLERRSQNDSSKLEKSRAKAAAVIAEREKAIKKKDKEVDQAKGAFTSADMDFKEQKQYTTEAEYWIHEAKTDEERDRWRKKFKKETDEEDRRRDARQYADARLQAVLAERKKLEAELDEVIAKERKNADLKRLAIVRATIQKKKGYNPAREIPLLDFLAAPTKVEQIVLDNLVDNYEFSTPKKVDRCGTCHMLSKEAGYDATRWPIEFANGGDPAKFEKAVYLFVYGILDSVTPKVPRKDKYHYKNDQLRTTKLHHKTLEMLFAEYDPETGEIGMEDKRKEWRKYARSEKSGKWVQSKKGHSIAEYFQTVLDQMEPQWRSHSHLDDMVGSASPHPYEKFGCSTCHLGRGWSVDFGLAFHTPDRIGVDDWMTEERAHADHKHLPLSAGQSLEHAMKTGNSPDPAFVVTKGWVTDKEKGHDWEENRGWTESKRHYWKWPQLPKMLIQSSCLKCHKEGLYETPKPEYEHVHIGKPDMNLPDTFEWSLHAASVNQDLLESPDRLLIPDTDGKEPYRPENLERGMDDFLRFGCAGCHKLDPTLYTFMKNERPKAGPPLDEIATKTTKSWARKWVRNPKEFRAWTRMPRFFGLSNNSHDFRYRFAKDGFDDVNGGAWSNAEIYSIVEWIWAESEGRARKYAAVDLSRGDAKRGEQIVVGDGTPSAENKAPRAKACIACHDIEISDPDLAYDAAKVKSATNPDTGWNRRMSRRQGPNLKGIGSKVKAEWLFAWLRDPRSYWHRTNMPNLRLGEQEALDVTAFLMKSKHGDFDGLADVSFVDPDIKVIAEELRVAEARESTQEALNAVASMSSRERTLYVGKKLFKHHGCFGCHTIEEYKDATPIGTELTEWGSKLIDRLEFNHAPIEHERFDFAYTKLINPRIYDLGMPRRDRPFERLRMPRFGLTPEEAKDLSTFLVGLVADPIPEKSLFRPDQRQTEIIRGRQIVRRYNCQACHVIEGKGGDIWPVVSKEKWRPPDLIGQGIKTNPQWLFRFMKEPAFVALPGVGNSDRVRPWHSIRMPTFGLTDEEARSLVRYFAALSNAQSDFETAPADGLSGPRYASAKTVKLSNLRDRSKQYDHRVRDRVEEARALFQEYQCKSCHSPDSPIENAAPDFRHARGGRLREAWIETWLWAPLKLQPGTAMPMFFAGSEGPVAQDPQFFGASPDEQIRALRDFVRHHYREEDK